MKKLLLSLVAFLAVPSLVNAFPIVPYVQISSGVVQPGGFSTQYGTVGTFTAGSITDTGLSAGQCVQSGTGGLLTVTGSACGVSNGLLSSTNTFTGGNTFTSSVTAIGSNRFGNSTILSSSSLYFADYSGSFLTQLKNDSQNKHELSITAPEGIGINTSSTIARPDSPSNYINLIIGGAGDVGSFAVFGSSANSSKAYSGFKASTNISSNTLWTLPTIDGSNGQALTTNGAGVLSFSAVSGGGTSALQITNSGVQVTSPTNSINFNSQGFLTAASGTTAYISLNSATTDFIHNQAAAQTATANISSASVNTQLNLPYITNLQLLYSSSGSVAGSADTLIHSGNSILNLTDTSNPYSSGVGYGIQEVISGHLGAPSTLYGWNFSLGGAIAGDVYGTYVNAANISAASNYALYGKATGGLYNYGLYISSGQAFIASSMTIAGAVVMSSGVLINSPGDGQIVETVFGTTFTVTSSSFGSVGNVAVIVSTWGNIGGYSNFKNNGSTITESGVYTITESNVSGITGAGITFNYLSSTMTISSATILNLAGTVLGDNAAAGMVGEYISSVPVTALSFPTSGNYGDLAAISLTAGDWDVSAVLASQANSATVTTMSVGISSNTGNSSANLNEGDTLLKGLGPTAATDTSAAIPSVRLSLTATTTYYLKFAAGFSVAVPKALGRISARRIR